MAEETLNLGLIKPAGDEYFDIRHFNNNADKIDNEITQIKKNIKEPVLWDNVTDKPESYNPSVHNHIWDEITDKPESFTPDTHTHLMGDLRGILPVSQGGTGTDNEQAALEKLMYRGTISGNTPTNPDCLKETGTYQYILTTEVAGTINLPGGSGGVTYGILFVFGASTFAAQLFFCVNTGELYFRTYLESSWNNWKKVTTS